MNSRVFAQFCLFRGLMAPQRTTTEHGNPPGTGAKHLLVVGTRAARQRTGKKALPNATAPTAKLSLMAAADATDAATGVNPLYTLRKGLSLTKTALTLDQKSREDDHNTTRAPSDPTTNDAEQHQFCLVKAMPTLGEAAKADDHHIQLDASGHPALQNSEPPSAADMNCHQASWSSRDPSGDDEMDQAAWSTVVSRGARKKAIAPTPMKKQPGGDGDKHDTVILRPRERVRVTELSPKDLKTALAKSIDNHSKYERCYRIRIQEVTNTIAVDTWLPHLAEHFLKLKTIRTPDKEIPVSTYLALNGNQVRGVIYGIDPTDDPENLLPNLVSTTHWILEARPMGKNSKTALITFEGRRTPRYVTYYDCVRQVCAYRPRAVVCTHCHAIGHKADICPNEEEQRCPDCGREHMHGEDGCMDTSPQCKNCKGAHLATDSSCPKWREANEQLRQKGKTGAKPRRDRRQAPRSRRSSDPGPRDESTPRDRAAQLPKGEEIPTPTPPPKTEGHFPALPKTAIAPATSTIEEREDEDIPRMVQAMKAALKGSRSRVPTRGQMETTQWHSEPLQHQATYTATNISQASSERDQALVTRAEFKTSMEGMIASIKADLQNTIMSVVREIVQNELKAMITPVLHEAVRSLFQGQENSSKLNSSSTNTMSHDSQDGFN